MVMVVVVVMVLYGRHSVNNCSGWWWRRWGVVVLLAEGRKGAHDLGRSEHSDLMLIYATAPAATVNDNRGWTLLEGLLPFTRIVAMRKRRGRRRRRRRQRGRRSRCCARLQGGWLLVFRSLRGEGGAGRGSLHPTHLLMLIVAG